MPCRVADRAVRGSSSFFDVVGSLDDEQSILLYVHLAERNLLWYGGVLSATFAMARSFVPTADAAAAATAATATNAVAAAAAAGHHGMRGRSSAPEEALRAVAEHTHYLPDRWRARAHTFAVRDEFLTLYK